MRRWVLPAWGCTALLLVPLALACNGAGTSLPKSATLVINATATALPTATPRAPEARTGIAEVDTLIDALLVEPARARREALRPLLGFTPLPCTFASPQLDPQPVCRAGEQEAQPVDAFSFDNCGAQYLRPDELDFVVILLANSTTYAVYRAPESLAGSADYVAVVYDVTGNERVASELLLQSGRITSFVLSCTMPPEEFVEALGLTDVVYEAEGG